MSKMSTTLIGQLWTLFTYWCHICYLRFRQVNLVVVGRQMVSLVSVHRRGSLFDVYGLLHFSLVPVGFMGQHFCVFHDDDDLLFMLVYPGLCVFSISG